MTEIKEIFKKEHVGQKVHCLMRGNGAIARYNDDYNSRSSRIIVEFDLFVGSHYSYYDNGRYEGNSLPTLSFDHKEPVEFDYGKPKMIYVPVKLDNNAVWCWVGDTLEDLMSNRAVDERRLVVTGNKNISFKAVCEGLPNSSTNDLISWQYAMAIPEDGL